MNYDEKIEQAMTLLEQYSAQYTAIASKSKFSCGKGCSSCCQVSTVEATPIEMAPLAQFLLSQESLDAVLKKLETANRENVDRCIFFLAHNADATKGSCGIYRFRPFICRAFGYYKYLDKYAVEHVSQCSKMVSTELERRDPSALNEVLTHSLAHSLIADAGNHQVVDESAQLPILSQWKAQFDGSFEATDSVLLPINQAILLALQRAAYQSDQNQTHQNQTHQNQSN